MKNGVYIGEHSELGLTDSQRSSFLGMLTRRFAGIAAFTAENKGRVSCIGSAGLHRFTQVFISRSVRWIRSSSIMKKIGDPTG